VRFESIKRISPEGNEYWSSRDFARVLGYTDYRNFEAVIEKARTACFNSSQRAEDHFVEITDPAMQGTAQPWSMRAYRTVTTP
jgi:DNA-damage-inducible protein D